MSGLSLGSSLLPERDTNIHVCVRVRPILPTDAAAAADPHPHQQRRGRRRPLAPGAETGGGGGGGGGTPPRGTGGAVGNFARTTESSPGGGWTKALPALHPAWEVVASEASADADAAVGGGISWRAAEEDLLEEEEEADGFLEDTLRQHPGTNPDPARRTAYTFDRVCGPSTRNEQLYTDSVADVVRASLEGYHGSVFAYGQTSTGKTHTMTGTADDPGIVPLAVRDCFRFIRSQSGAEAGWEDREYLLRVSYMEIYNEQIHDLLAPAPVTRGGRRGGPGVMGPPTSSSSAAVDSTAIRIFESKTEGVVVRGVKEEVVTGPDQVFELLAAGEARRRTGSTALNRGSSRSHSIFRLIIESRLRGGRGRLWSSSLPNPATGKRRRRRETIRRTMNPRVSVDTRARTYTRTPARPHPHKRARVRTPIHIHTHAQQTHGAGNEQY